MRSCLVLLAFCLTGCLYYGDMHSHSRPYTPTSLSIHQTYLTPRHLKMPDDGNWWKGFNDPQLDQLIILALCNSPSMQIAAARVRKANQLALEASSALWPTIDLVGTLQRQRFAEFGLVPPPFNGKIFNIGTAGLNLNYEFDFWGKNRGTFRAQLDEACAAKAEWAATRLIISASVATAYFELLKNIEKVKIAEEIVNTNEKIAAITANRLKHGINSDIPWKRTQDTVQRAKITLQQYREAELLSRHQLAALMGKNPFTTEIETRKFVFHPYRIKLPLSLPATLLCSRPDIYAAKMRAIAAAERINVAKAYFFPDINLNAFMIYESVHINNLFAHENQHNALIGAIDLPIFDANARRANLGVKYAEYDLAINDYNQTIIHSLHEVADQLSLVKSLKQEITEQDAALSAIRHNYQLFKSQYRHGIIDSLQVLASKLVLMQRQTEQIELQARYAEALAATLKALGGRDLIIREMA